jgi:hypothetical protein
MKRIIFITFILLSVWGLHAQKDTTFYKHEVKLSLGPSIVSGLWIQEGICHTNISLAYFYRPLKWLWVGGNFINFLGNKLSYSWREYDIDGSFSDHSKSKLKYCAAFAPEIRFSFLNKKRIILYGALSGGIIIEDGYDTQHHTYPKIRPYLQLTYFGISGNLGKNSNIFLGTELGIGWKGLVSIHGGYRF